MARALLNLAWWLSVRATSEVFFKAATEAVEVAEATSVEKENGISYNLFLSSYIVTIKRINFQFLIKKSNWIKNILLITWWRRNGWGHWGCRCLVKDQYGIRLFSNNHWIGRWNFFVVYGVVLLEFAGNLWYQSFFYRFGAMASAGLNRGRCWIFVLHLKKTATKR